MLEVQPELETHASFRTFRISAIVISEGERSRIEATPVANKERIPRRATPRCYVWNHNRFLGTRFIARLVRWVKTLDMKSL